MTRPGEEGAALSPREIAERILLLAFDVDSDRVLLLAEYRAELDDAEGWIRDRLAAELAAARAEVEVRVTAARSDALEEAARIVGTFGRLAAMADPGPFATVNYALVPLDADHIPSAIRAARTAEAPHGR